MNKLFFNNFITNFFEGIEDEFLAIMKKEKVKKLSVTNFEIDVIDYLDNSKTPILETIKETSEGLFLYIKNKEQTPSPYTVEEVFHPFSLAVLCDKLTKKNKYTELLENFYIESEELVKNFLKEKNLKNLNISDKNFELLALSKSNGSYEIADDIIEEILLINDRVFFSIKNEGSENLLAHIVECNAADLALILNNILFQ